MEFLLDFLPILIYILLIVILIVGIIVGVNFIKTMRKVEKVVDDVNDKVQSLNSFFQIIDFTTDKISDKMVDGVSKFISHIFKFGKNKKKKKIESDGEEE